MYSYRLAEEHKLKGNAAYKAGRYQDACDSYTKAIFHNPNCATYWSNRSAALMMLEDFASALDDCTQAIKLDESYTKVRRDSLYGGMYNIPFFILVGLSTGSKMPFNAR